MQRSPKPPTHAPVVGQKVDYYELMARGQDPSHPGAVVNSEVRLLGGHTWVVGIVGKNGVVALDHCRRSEEEPAPWPEFTPERSYKITWEIELTAATPLEAAEKAEVMQREITGPSTFKMVDEFGIKSTIDLAAARRVRGARLVSAEEISAAGGRLDAEHYVGRGKR